MSLRQYYIYILCASLVVNFHEGVEFTTIPAMHNSQVGNRG